MPLGKTLCGRGNPVRTGGPMQVGIAFAEAHASRHDYPWPIERDIRRRLQLIVERDGFLRQLKGLGYMYEPDLSIRWEGLMSGWDAVVQADNRNPGLRQGLADGWGGRGEANGLSICCDDEFVGGGLVNGNRRIGD